MSLEQWNSKWKLLEAMGQLAQTREAHVLPEFPWCVLVEGKRWGAWGLEATPRYVERKYKELQLIRSKKSHCAEILYELLAPHTGHSLGELREDLC